MQDSENEKTSSSVSLIQTAATLVVAVAAVFSVLAQSKDNPRLAWALIFVALLVAGSTFSKPVIDFVRERKLRTVRNKAAKDHYVELLQFSRRFAKFVASGDPSNLRNIIFNLCDNYIDKHAMICSPDYLREIFPHFQGRITREPPVSAARFYETLSELYCLVATYNRDYVIEPFRRMRSNLWPRIPSVIERLIEGTDLSKPDLGPWLASFPEQKKDDAVRRIEDFRERWVSFLDDFSQYLENVNESAGLYNLPTYFERPQKL